MKPEASTATAAEAAPYARRWWGLIVLALSLVLIGMDNTILNVAIPTLIREVEVTNTELQWILDSYVLVFAGLLLTAGAIGDRFGRKGALNFGLLVFTGAALYATTTDDAAHLIAARAVMGLGGAFIMPSTLSILTNMFPPEERGRAIGVWAGVAGVGIPLGPLLGGWLLAHFDWNSVFFINVPLALGALALGQWLLPTSRDAKAPRLDVGGAVLSMAALSVLIFGLIEAGAKGWGSSEVLLALGVATVLLAVFGWWEYRVKEPMLDLRFFRNPRFTAANLSVTLVFFALFGAMLSLTQYLQFTLGYDALESGFRMLPMAIGMMIGAPLSARADERFGSKVVVTAGLGVAALGMLLMTRFQVDTSYPEFLLTLMVMSFGMGFTMAPATEAIMGAIPRSKSGVGSAMNDTTRQVGGALGIATIGSLITSAYADGIRESFQGMPAEALAAAQDSLGAALAIASESGAAGPALALAANEAFVDAMRIGLYAGAAVAGLGAVIALVFLPARGIDAGEDFEDEDVEPPFSPEPAEAAV